MEDGDTAEVGIPGMTQDKAVAWFGVFDGHAGSTVSDKAQGKLLKCIQDTQHFNKYIQKETDITKEEFTQGIKKGVQEGFLAFDEKMRDLLALSEEDNSGSTAVCALVTHKYIVLVNCGDSRGLICTKGAPSLATIDHKPTDEEEKRRIEKAGGKVVNGRVEGSLAVARALGDFEYKKVKEIGPTQQMVSPEPDIYIKEIDPEDEFIVLACDGVWDVMNNNEICKYISSRLKVTNNLETLAEEVLDTCLHKDSKDNMTIIIVTFPGAPKPDPEATKIDKKLDEILEKKLIDLIAKNPEDPLSLTEYYQKLTEEHLEGLPPAGGLSSKRAFIEKLYQKHLPEKYKKDNQKEERYWDQGALG